MPKSIFVTGGTGFIGRHVVERLKNSGFDRVVCLAREVPPDVRAHVEWLSGDVLEPASYAHAIDSSTVVLHMAAATGKASAADHRQINVGGTEAIVRVCRERKAGTLVLVSSIAARYANLRSYPYGQAKRDAEALVVQSGLRHLIVRPTIVFGPDSPIWQKFRQLSSGPVIPLIGSGRAQVQPIHVADAANALVRLAADGAAEPLIELGGPETTSLGELLKRIHFAVHGKDARTVRVPFTPIRAVLGMLEPWAQRFLPVTAGQLSVFVNDGTVQPTATLRALWPGMMTVDQMLQALEPGRA